MNQQPQTVERLSEKRRLLDAVEALRTPPANPAILPSPAVVVAELSATELRRQLRESEETCAMLEEEVRQLEAQTLEALAEVGRLRRRLDLMTPAAANGNPDECSRERDTLREILATAEEERRLLTTALIDSENELARMTRTLDLMMRRLQAA